MAYGWGLAWAVPLAAVLTAGPAGSVFAQEAETEAEAEQRAALSTVLFGSLEAGPAKTFVSLGMKKALTGTLAGSGFRTLLKVGGAREQAPRQSAQGLAYKSESQALIGYEWRIGDTFLALYAGSDHEGEQREWRNGLLYRNRYGVRVQGDLWMTPMPGAMLHASAYASTLDRRLWGRAAPGWLLPQGWLSQDVYAGPEVEAYRAGDYTKLRLGLHLTGLRLFGVVWRLSGGWQRTSDRPSEAYATLGVHWLR